MNGLLKTLGEPTGVSEDTVTFQEMLITIAVLEVKYS